jgi:hypothetical protein
LGLREITHPPWAKRLLVTQSGHNKEMKSAQRHAWMVCRPAIYLLIFGDKFDSFEKGDLWQATCTMSRRIIQKKDLSKKDLRNLGR